MEEFRLCNSDYRFMMLVWEHFDRWDYRRLGN